uniref:Uncharacterized protein n=1 Tax=Haplochromis burtoni TaxID=8153 RepID=A0A3Q2VHG3_HAPBU
LKETRKEKSGKVHANCLPDLSTAASQVTRSSLVACMEAASFRLQLNTLPRLFIGASVSDGILMVPSENKYLSVTFSFFSTRDLDLVGLNLMRDSRPFSVHLHPGTDVVVTVRLSMKALMDLTNIWFSFLSTDVVRTFSFSLSPSRYLSSLASHAVFISGPVPPVRGGDERFSRLFALNKWLISACTDHSVHFINNCNIFWECWHLFKANVLNFNKSGVKLFTSNLFYSICHPSVLGARAEINDELSHKEEQTVLQEAQQKP